MRATNLGSRCHPVHLLARRAAQPFWPAADQANHDYAALTNLEHAEHSGVIVHANELRFTGTDRPLPRTNTCSTEQMVSIAHRYLSCLRERDAAGWVALFEPDAALTESEHSRPYVGHARLRLFIEQMFATFSSLDPVEVATVPETDRLVVEWTLHGKSLGAPVRPSGREHFFFAPSGKLAAVTVEWNPAEVAEMLRRHVAGPDAARRDTTRHVA